MSFQIRLEKKESENKTIRFPLPLVQEIDKVIDKSQISFSGFVIQACEYALANLDEEDPLVR